MFIFMLAFQFLLQAIFQITYISMITSIIFKKIINRYKLKLENRSYMTFLVQL